MSPQSVPCGPRSSIVRLSFRIVQLLFHNARPSLGHVAVLFDLFLDQVIQLWGQPCLRLCFTRLCVAIALQRAAVIRFRAAIVHSS